VTVTTGDPAKQDDPSLVTATTVQYGGAALPEGSTPSPTALGSGGANVPTTEQLTALNQAVSEVTAESLTTPAPMELGTATAELEGVPATPERLDQTAPFVPSGFSDPSEVVVIQEDQTVIGNLLAGTTSPDGAITITTFEVNGVTYTAGQLASIEGIGSISITTTGTYTFTPLPNWNGVLPEVIYSMTDGFSADTSTLNITVNPLNDPATITSQAEGLTETDIVLSTSGQLVVTDVDVGEAQVIPQAAVSGQYGDFNISADGSWTYVTHSPYNELPAGEQLSESFTVTSEDGTAVGSVAITITGTNDLAAVSSQSMSLLETNTVLSTNGVLNITDVDTGEAHVVAQTNVSGLYGQFNIEEGGAWTYVTNSAFDELPAGAQISESFSVTSHDGTGFGSVTVTVTGTNDIAVLSAESQTLLESDEALQASGALVINDVDAGEAFVTPRTDVPGSYGTFSIDANGAWTYDANSAFNELNAGDRITDRFTVNSADGTATNTVTLTIIGTNDLATVSSAIVSLDETNAALSTGGSLQIGDLDENEAHVTPQTNTLGANGVFSINADGQWTYVANSAFDELNAGDVISDQFAVTSVDGTATNTVTISIVGTNDQATVSSATVVLNETNEVLSTGGTLQIADPDQGEAHVVAQANVDGSWGTFSIDADGVWTYIAHSDYNELNANDQLGESFTISSQDGTAIGTVSVSIIGTNDIATLSSASVTLNETNDVLSTGGRLIVEDVDENEAHVRPMTNVDGLHGTFSIASDGTWSYLADSAFNELNEGDQITDQFTVTSQDGTATNTVTVTILGTNDQASVSYAVVTLDETDSPLSIGGSLVVIDPDDGEAHVVPQTNAPGTYGTFSIDADGIWSYQANSAYDALNAGDRITDTFQVTSQDGTATGTVTVTIVGTNDLATVSSSIVQLNEQDVVLNAGGTLSIGDLDDGEAHVNPISGLHGLHGTFSMSADGVWTYVTDSAFNELNAGDQISDTFTINSVDGSATGTVQVIITGTNDLATVSSETVILNETNAPLSTGGTLTALDLDAGEAHVEVQTNIPGDYGVFSIDEQGVWTYVANSAFDELLAGQEYTDHFDVTSHDGTGLGVVTVTIIGTSDNPVIGSLQVTASEIAHDETVGIQSVGGANDSSAAIASAFNVITETPLGVAEIANAAVLSGVADYRPSTGGTLEITGYQLTNADKAGFTGEATNLQVTGGDQILLYTEGELIVGREVGTNNVAFAVYIDDVGTVQLVQYLAIDHGDGSGTEDATQGANELRNLLIGSNSPIYVTEFVTATNVFGESSDFEIRSSNALQVGFLDDGPSVDFANTVAPVNENNLYTGTWTFQSGVDTQTGIQDLVNTLAVSSVSVSGQSVSFSALGTPELVDGKLVYNGTFDFDADPDPLVTENKTVNYTLTLQEQSPGQYQYTLDLDKAIQNITINDSEFSGSVHAGGPTPLYELTYTDTATQDTLTAQVTVQSGFAPTQNVIGTSTTINPIFVGSALNASSNGIGIDTPNMDSSIIKGSKGQPDTYTVEGMNFNPEGETSQVTIGFKGSGSPSWGNTDVLHVTIHGVAVDTLAPIEQQLVLTGMGSPSSPIAGTIHVPAGSASYTINLPEGMAYIESVDVSAGFGSDARGNIVPTVANITFGFATITSVEIADLPIQFEFQAAVTDADGDLAYDTFTVETMTGSIAAGTAGADDLNGTLLADNIAGGGGIDDISGDAGADFLIGGAEGDVISGGEGADTIYGDADITSSAAYAGNDTISGDAGADIIHGDGGSDTIMGGSGEDVIHGDSGDDVITGGTENDTLYGDSGNDVIAGDAGNDTISGGEGDDTITGGAGDDILQGGAGSDILTGGEGNDTFVLSDDGGVDTIIDFQPGDQIDLGDILPNAPEIDPAQFQDYVQIVDDGDSGAVSLWIDADGSGTDESWEHVAELENVDSETVSLHFDPATQTIDFTDNPGDWDVSESTISPDDLINSGRK
jgi:VCBS repeat-containing protein